MKVDCNECGASLPVGSATRYVTCTRCASRLVVTRSGAAIYTELVVPDSKALEEELAEAHSEAGLAASAPQVGGGESLLRLVVGALLIASDLFWWLTDPSLQSLYVRLALLAAGLWLVLTGAWKLVAGARVRLRAQHEAKEQIALKKAELQRALAAEGERDKA